MKTYEKILLYGGVTIALTLSLLNYLAEPSEDDLRRMYYEQAVATLQSPHGYREQMDKGLHQYTLVDVRAEEDYVSGHITGAINIDSGLGTAMVIEKFSELSEDKDILIYCYSTSCLNGRKVGRVLAQNGIYVKELSVGWNEWRYAPETWNYPEELDTLDIMDYITEGTEPGVHERKNLINTGCDLNGELNC